MKKLSLCTTILSILFFQCQGSQQTPEEFFQTEITPEYIEAHYPGFIERTEGQYNKMHGIGAKVAGFFGKFFSAGKMSEDDTVQQLAVLYGYNGESRRLLGIGREVLDDQWRQRLADIRVNCSYEYMEYINEAKKYIENHVTAPYNTNDSLNQAMYHLHHFHVNTLQREQGFDDNYAAYLKQNYEKNQDGLYPMHAHVNRYKNENNGRVHPYTVLNMLLFYLLGSYKVTPKGS